jgi:hypothetical protein
MISDPSKRLVRDRRRWRGSLQHGHKLAVLDGLRGERLAGGTARAAIIYYSRTALAA